MIYRAAPEADPQARSRIDHDGFGVAGLYTI
jgi:hypothetical protein